MNRVRRVQWLFAWDTLLSGLVAFWVRRGRFFGGVTRPEHIPDVDGATKDSAYDKIMKVKVNRAAFPTVVHAARQIIVCDKLHQLGGGFILTSQGVFQSDGRLICGDPTAPANLFFPPRRP